MGLKPRQKQEGVRTLELTAYSLQLTANYSPKGGGGKWRFKQFISRSVFSANY